jgi:hypothetical protein
VKRSLFGLAPVFPLVGTSSNYFSAGEARMLGADETKLPSFHLLFSKPPSAIHIPSYRIAHTIESFLLHLPFSHPFFDKAIYFNYPASRPS